MNANKLFSEFSLKKIWDKIKQHDKAMNSTLLILSSGNWIEQSDGTFINTIPYSSFTENDKVTVDLYDDGINKDVTTLQEYALYIDEFWTVNGGLTAIANTKPTQTMTLVVKGDFEAKEIDVSDVLRRLGELESNFTMAADAIGNALVAKEVEVPEGTSLLEMADIINNLDSLSKKYSIYYNIDNNVYYSESIHEGDSILHPTTFTPTKDGYTFVGWRYDNTATNTVLSEEVATKTEVLYAVFQRTIILSYNGNSSTSGSVAAQTGTQYYNNGNTVNPSFKLSANGFTRTNYTFTQWAQGSASGTKYAVGASVVLSNNTTFYAVWLAHNDLIKTLNASDWSVTSNNNGAKYTFTKGTSLVMSATNKSWSDIGIRSTSIDITHFKTLQVSVSNKSSGTGLSFNLVTTSGSVSILNGGSYDISQYTGQAYITGYACSGYSGSNFKTAGLTCTKLLFS